MVMASPSPEFVGPMPAVTLSGTLSAPAVAMVPPSPEFVGPMPAVTRAGPMPAPMSRSMRRLILLVRCRW